MKILSIKTAIEGKTKKPVIQIQFNEKINKKIAEETITVKPSVPGVISVNREGMIASWSPKGKILPGKYTLKLSELTNTKFSHYLQKTLIPFTVKETWKFDSKISKDLLVLHKTKMKLSNGEYERAKIYNSTEKTFFDVTYDKQGETVDFDELIHEHNKIILDKYGKIHPTLFKKIKKIEPNATIPVALWISTEEEMTDKSKFDVETLEKSPNELLLYREQISKSLENISKKIHEVLEETKIRRMSKIAPVIFIDLTSEQIEQVAKLEEITSLMLYEPKGIDDLGDSLEASNADTVIDTMGYDGSGVKVAVWERGPDNQTNLDIEDEYDATPSTSSHARLTLGIIKNTEIGAPNGYAPDCLLYAANSYDIDALDWAVGDMNCTVISQSFHRSSEETSPNLSFDDRYKDYLAIHYPYPIILQAAGNSGGTTEYVNHKGYNSLAVGNHNDDADEMSGTSVSRNPSTPHSDRELPEICANGTVVTAAQTTNSGTSFSAPAVAGSVALLQEIDSSLKYWPEAIRAILLAAPGINITDSTWREDVYDDVDAHDGSGALDTYMSALIAQNYKNPDNVPCRRGWGKGMLTDSSFDGMFCKYVYKIKVPAFYWFSRKIKIALAWSSKVSQDSSDYTSELGLDLDLLVYDENGHLVTSSSSWDNSYEIAEFMAQRGKTYTIKIRKWSGSNISWYGIAWTYRSFFSRVQFEAIAFAEQILQIAQISN